MSVTRNLKAIPPGSKEDPSALNWRFEFEGYPQTRYFLDEMASLSEYLGYYPNISFGKTYVNVTIEAEDQALLVVDKTYFVTEMKALAAREITQLDSSAKPQ